MRQRALFTRGAAQRKFGRLPRAAGQKSVMAVSTMSRQATASSAQGVSWPWRVAIKRHRSNTQATTSATLHGSISSGVGGESGGGALAGRRYGFASPIHAREASPAPRMISGIFGLRAPFGWGVGRRSRAVDARDRPGRLEWRPP